MGSWRTCESCNTDEEAESWFGYKFTAGSWDVLGCCSLICVLVSLMLWLAALFHRFSTSCSFPLVPHLPKSPCAMPAVLPCLWTGVSGSLQVFSDSLKAPNCKPLCTVILLLSCGEAGFLATLCPQLPGQGWASCRWWDLQSLLLKRCTKHSCEMEMTSDRRCAFASCMWYNPVLIKAATADY